MPNPSSISGPNSISDSSLAPDPGLGPDLGSIKGLLFDKDGTLVDINASWLQPIKAAAQLVATHTQRPELADQLLIHGGYLPETDSWTPDSIIAFETTQAMLDLWSKLTSPELIRSLAPSFQALVTQSLVNAHPIVEDTAQLFANLSKRYALGVASMDDEINVKHTLDGLNLHASLDFYCGADSGFGQKPEAGMVNAFCERTSLSPKNIAVIGDASHDLKMAKAAGSIAIAVLSGASRAEDLTQYADFVFTDIADFARQLRPGIR